MPECLRVKNPNINKGKEFLALHTVLMAKHADGSSTAAGAAVAAAAVAAATDLITALVNAFPESVASRVMVPDPAAKKPPFPWGHTALDLALRRGWGAAVIGAMINANPPAACILDPSSAAIAKKMGTPDSPSDALPNVKKCLHPNKIAKGNKPPDAVVVGMLPTPKKVKGEIGWFKGKAQVSVAQWGGGGGGGGEHREEDRAFYATHSLPRIQTAGRDLPRATRA